MPLGYRRAGVLLLALLAPVVAATPLYKLVDRNGRVTFTDTPPKAFDGQVTRMEPTATPSVAPPATPRGRLAPEPAAAASEGFLGRRQREQAELLARLDRARLAVEAARQAKDNGHAATPDEMQVIQRRYPTPRAGQPAPFSNCARRIDPAGGAQVLICPTQVPGPAYHERQRKLEASLSEAQAALAEAERAYRRGID